MNEHLPIFMLSGMGANERLFEAQMRRFPNLRVVPWIVPHSGESLRAYAARLAETCNPGCPCLVGGASFGGMVAREMAGHLQAIGCILICSVRSSDELPRAWRMLRPLAYWDSRRIAKAAAILASWGRTVFGSRTIRRLKRISQPRSAFFRWASCAVLRWRPSLGAKSVPAFQIHGDRDQTLPITATRPDVIVANGGHLLPITHPDVVNEFIQSVLDALICGKRPIFPTVAFCSS